jgi:nucleoside-diphosphate-sugar epimerase
MKALVTGGTGFIGSRVVDLLAANGHRVRLFSRRPELPSRFAGKEVSLFPGDLKDPDAVLDAMAGMEVFYHIGEIKNSSPRAAKMNVQLMQRILERIGTTGTKRLVFVSSLTVAGIPSQIPATEETSPRITLADHYTWYKRQCEQLLAGNVGGVEYVVLRPGIVYGSGSRYLKGLISAIDTLGPVGMPFIGRGGSVAPLIHANDLAHAVYLAGIERGAAGHVFNLTSGESDTWSDFLNAMADALGKKLRILPVPPLLLKASSRFLDVMSGLFRITLSLNAYVQYVTTDLLFDNGKARRMLNWAPDITLSEGVEEMVREYREKRDGPGKEGG